MLRRLVTSKKPLVIVPVVLALVLAGLFLPVEVSIEPYGVLSLESKITISIGYDVAYAAPDTETLRPNADGTYTKWDPYGGTGHWECVDEVTPDETTYVFTSANNEHDSYNLQNHVTGSGTISNVRVYARAMSVTAGDELAIGIVIGITTDTGPTITLTASYVDYSQDWEQNPVGPAAWTWSDIDALEAGVKNFRPSSEVRVTTVWVVVTYTPAVEDITNLPTSKDFGNVTTSTNYWAYGGTTAPGFPLDNSECFFEVTNNSSQAVNIAIKAIDFSGGTPGWTLGATPGADTIVLKAGESGDNVEGDMVTLTTSDQAFIASLDASSSKMWELKMETPTSYSNGDPKTSTITLTATFP